jgi:aspartate/methionine/tyrosine aminotransferase
MDGSEPDLLEYYTEHYRPGVIDLSASCPPPMPIEGFDHSTLRADDLAFVPPSGAPELRAAIAVRYRMLEADGIRVCAGASEALVAIAFATLRAGDVAWVAPGAYPSFTEAALKLGARLAGGEAIPLGVRIALAANPTVPEGRILALRAFVGEGRSAGAVTVVDEVYRDLHAGGPLEAVADVDAAAVSVGDLSKPLGLGGIRIGWVATRDRDLLGRIDRELQLLSGGPSSLSVAAAESAFQSFDASVAATMQAACQNLPGITSTLERHGWTVVLPEAGITLLATPPAAVGGAAMARLAHEGFFLLPGQAIGAPGAYRISLLREPETIERALRVLEGER